MEDLIASIPVLSGVAVAAALIFIFSSRAKTRRRNLIMDLAAANRWDYQPIDNSLETGFRLSSGGWTFESISKSSSRSSESGSADISHSAAWKYPLPGPADRIVYFGERPPGANTETGAGLVRQAFTLALGSEGVGMQEVQAGTSAFRQRYLVMTRRPQDAEYLLGLNLEHQLVHFPGPAPVIRVDPGGIQMKIEGRKVEKPEEILPYIRLGEALVDTLRTL